MSPGYLFDIPDPSEAFSTPLDVPLLGRPPARFLDCEILTIQYRSDPDAIRAIVPRPLTPTGDTVMVQFGRWGDVPGMGQTFECNVMVAVRLDRPSGPIVGAYSPYFFVDNDRALAGGRELNGQPKRLAEVSIEARGDLHVATLTRNGIAVFTGTMAYKPSPATLDDVRARVDPVTNINLKIVPNIDSTMAIRQLTARVLGDVSVSECWTGPSTTEVHPNPQAPLYRLPVRGFLEGYYWRAAFSVVGGTIIHDYLA
jgi:acetoacetate decarboxylase